MFKSKVLIIIITLLLVSTVIVNAEEKGFSLPFKVSEIKSIKIYNILYGNEAPKEMISISKDYYSTIVSVYSKSQTNSDQPICKSIIARKLEILGNNGDKLELNYCQCSNPAFSSGKGTIFNEKLKNILRFFETSKAVIYFVLLKDNGNTTEVVNTIGGQIQLNIEKSYRIEINKAFCSINANLNLSEQGDFCVDLTMRRLIAKEIKENKQKLIFGVNELSPTGFSKIVFSEGVEKLIMIIAPLSNGEYY